MARACDGLMRALRLVPVVALVVLGGCSSIQLKTDTDYDRQAKFSAYKTYALEEGDLVNNGVVDTSDNVVRDRIDAALATELSQKGLQPARANPDLIVTYTAERELQEQEAVGAMGRYRTLSYEGTIDGYPHATLVIDVIDADTQKLVYRAVARADNEDFRKPALIQKAVEKALAKYPPQQPSA